MNEIESNLDACSYKDQVWLAKQIKSLSSIKDREQKQNKKYALVTMCIGVGQGYATIIERV
mgnify:CR=1 FL=1